MFATSLVLGPTVVGTMPMRGTCGSAFSLHRSMSNVATSATQSYYFPMMGLFGAAKQRDLEEPDNRGESSGSASGTLHHGGSGSSGSVSSGRGNQKTARAGGRSGHGANNHLSRNQAHPGQPRMMEVESSRAMVEDYVRHSLEEKGIQWHNGQRDVTPSQVQKAMRDLGDQLEGRFSQNMDRMVSDLHLTQQNGQEKLTEAMDELFVDGEVNWGRISVLVKFAGKLSVHCAGGQRLLDGEAEVLVRSIVMWVSNYLDRKPTLKSWIAQNNGWEGFVKFCEGKKESGSSLKKLLTVVAAAAGIVTLTSLSTLLRS